MGTPATRRRRLVLAVPAAALALLLGCSDGESEELVTTTGAPATAPVTAVRAEGFAFVPRELTVPVGATVTWTNADAALHTVVGSGLSGELAASGGTYENTFAEPGTYTYTCTIHPTMTGTIIVA